MTVQGAVVRALRDDPVIQLLVGSNDWTTKVWDRSTIPENTEAPYIVVQRVPGGEPEGTYRDREEMKYPQVQVTAWGRTGDEAWQIAEEVPNVLKLADWGDVEPNAVQDIHSLGDEVELPDQETKWVQVPCTYRFMLSRV